MNLAVNSLEPSPRSGGLADRQHHGRRAPGGLVAVLVAGDQVEVDLTRIRTDSLNGALAGDKFAKHIVSAHLDVEHLQESVISHPVRHQMSHPRHPLRAVVVSTGHPDAPS